jgi:hypothetical protein
MRIPTLFALALLLPTVAPADASVIPAPATRAAPAAASTAQPGKAEVEGLKPLAEELRAMKTAINTPFSNDPKDYDDMVCRLQEKSSSRAKATLLDCGSQGWYGMQRTIHSRDMSPTEDISLTTTPTLGHPWHIVRQLNPQQVAALRQMLDKGGFGIESKSTPAPAAGTTPSP